MKTLESIRFTDRDGNSWEYGEEHTLRIYQPDGLFLPLPDGSVFLDAYENQEAGIPFWAVVRGFGETAAKAGISGLGVAEARQFSAETKTDLHTVPKAYAHWKTEGTTQIVQYGHSSSVYRPESFTFKALCGKDAITIAEKHSPAVDAGGKDRIWEPFAAHGNSSMSAMASISSSKGSSVFSSSAAENFKMLLSGCCFGLFRNMRGTCCVKLCNRVLGKEFFCYENKKLCYGCGGGCSAAVRVCLLVRRQRKRRRIRDDSSRSRRDDGGICGI